MSHERVLIWYWSGGGGGSQFAVRLAHKLRMRMGEGAVRLSLRADDPAQEYAAQLGVPLALADIRSDRRKPIMTAGQALAGVKILRDHAECATRVVVPMNFATAAPLSLLLEPRKLVYCAHDPEPHPGDYAQAAQRMTQRLLLSRAAHVVALSQFCATQLANLRGALHVAPLSSVFEPSAPAPALVSSGPVRLLLAGRMIAYKGLDLLADALKRLSHRDDWRLTLAGDGPALDEAMLRRFQMPQVTYARRAWLSDAELERLIKECDVLLLPYRSATQSGLIAQALACGKPCIVTPVGALSEQIGEGAAGWVSHDVSDVAFAEALMSVLDNPSEWVAKANKAHQLARAAWDADDWDWLCQTGAED